MQQEAGYFHGTVVQMSPGYKKNLFIVFPLFLLVLSTGLVVLDRISQQITVTLSVWCKNASIVALIAIILDNHSICL